jgi:hypothetical protein
MAVLHVQADLANSVAKDVFGNEQTLAAFKSSREVTAERLHPASSDSDNPWPNGPWDLTSYRRDTAARLSSTQVATIKRLLIRSSSYGWQFAKPCAPNYGVLFTFHSNPDVQVALCFECDTLGVFTAGQTSHPVNREEDCDAIRSSLLAICRALYPHDSAIQTLR